MSLNLLLERSGISLLLTLICFYYAYKVLVLHDVESIRGRGKPPLKDPHKYCRAAGRLILFFGLASLLMSVLLLFSAPIALAEIIAATAILGAGWAKMNREFGD